MVARAINNDTTRRFVDVIDYLVDGVEAGDNELNIPLLREKLEKGIPLRTKECACEWAGPEEDAGLGILGQSGNTLMRMSSSTIWRKGSKSTGLSTRRTSPLRRKTSATSASS